MTVTTFRRSFLAVLAVLSLVAVPAAAAGKRRAVAKPTAGPKITVNVKGIVRDNVTSQPAVNVKVTVGNRTDYTDSTGAYDIKGAVGYGVVPIHAERTGYATYSAELTAPGDHTHDFRMNPTATVTVKTTGGETLQVDLDSFLIGYAVPFSGYRAKEDVEFCLADGTRATWNRSQMKRFVGPAVTTTQSSCCDESLQKINLEIKGQAPADVIFAAKCDTPVGIDLIGRDHTGGMLRYIPFTQISEVVFP